MANGAVRPFVLPDGKAPAIGPRPKREKVVFEAKTDDDDGDDAPAKKATAKTKAPATRAKKPAAKKPAKD